MGVPICSTEMPAGRPKGTWGPKRRQLDADEADPDGSSRANKKANFFKSQIYDPHRCPPSTDSELSGHTPDVGMCDSVSETSVNTGALTTNTPILSASEVSDDVPDLPKRRDDRQDNTLYMYKGRLVRYQASGHAILCTCNGTSSCAGNVRLHECERRQESAHTEPVASRSKNNCDYKMMHSGTGIHRPNARSELLCGESQILQQGTAIKRFEHAAGLVVLDDGRYDIALVNCDDWTMTLHGNRFPLRPGLKWRKIFHGEHARAVGLSAVIILFEVGLCNKTFERPVFRARIRCCCSTQEQAKESSEGCCRSRD